MTEEKIDVVQVEGDLLKLVGDHMDHWGLFRDGFMLDVGRVEGALDADGIKAFRAVLKTTFLAGVHLAYEKKEGKEFEHKRMTRKQFKEMLASKGEVQSTEPFYIG